MHRARMKHTSSPFASEKRVNTKLGRAKLVGVSLWHPTATSKVIATSAMNADNPLLTPAIYTS